MAFRTVYVKNGERLGLRLDNLTIRKGGEEYTVPLIDIEHIILEGQDTVITTRLLAKLARYHIALTVCDQKYLPCGTFLGNGQYFRSAKRNIWQSNWSDKLKDRAWTVIVKQKIKNQIDVVRDFELDPKRIELMKEMYNQVENGDVTNREGHVAKLYFNTLYGVGFSRDSQSYPNICMNYGYSIIRAAIARACVAVGLLPSLGVHHINEYNPYNLVDDLMEPFRPLVDWYIHNTLIPSNDGYLTYEDRLTLIDFLNQSIYVNNRKLYINNAIEHYIQSFIDCMEKEDFSGFVRITLQGFKKGFRK